MTTPAAYTPSETTWVDVLPDGSNLPSLPNPAQPVATRIDAGDLNNMDRALTNTNFDLTVLKWTGTDYSPSAFKADTSKVRLFIGPTDPTTVTGVATQARDLWLNV